MFLYFLCERLLFGCFGSFSTVFRTTLTATINTCAIQCTTNQVVTYTGEVFYTTTAHQNDRVLLQVVALTGDVGIHLFLVGKFHTCYFTHCRVRLLGGGGVNTHAHTAPLGTSVKGGRFTLHLQLNPSFTYKLLNCWHLYFSFSPCFVKLLFSFSHFWACKDTAFFLSYNIYSNFFTPILADFSAFYPILAPFTHSFFLYFPQNYLPRLLVFNAHSRNALTMCALQKTYSEAFKTQTNILIFVAQIFRKIQI